MYLNTIETDFSVMETKGGKLLLLKGRARKVVTIEKRHIYALSVSSSI